MKHAFIVFAMCIALIQNYGQLYRVFSRHWTMLPEAVSEGDRRGRTGAVLYGMVWGWRCVKRCVNGARPGSRLNLRAAQERSV